jgi:hypothetical protein
MVGTIMITGAAGSVGHDIIQYISVIPGLGKIVGADMDEKICQSVVKDAVLSANFLGFQPDITATKINLFDVDETSNLLKEINPDVVCHCASLGSWWITRLLPPEIYKKVSPLGPWIPNHLTLTLNLMRAIGKAGIETKVVNACFPDLSNVALANLGLGPVCGGGNMDLLCNNIRYVVSKELKVSVNNIFVSGIGHHGAYYTARMGEPYFVKILVGDKDVTEKFPHDRLKDLCYAEGFFDRPQLKAPLANQWRVAASFLRNALAIYFNTGELRMSVPGPNGLPGAYPCRLSAEGAEVVLPDDLTLQDAVRINQDGARFDGIEDVRQDGTVVFLDENVRNMEEVLGYSCKELKISELEERARELNAKLTKCYEKSGVSRS